MVLDERGGPNHVDNLCDAPVIADTTRDDLYFQSSFYYLGHFSKFIRPGAVRIAHSVTTDALEVTAFQNSDNTIAVVVMNRTDEKIAFTLKADDKAVVSTSPAHSIITMIFASLHQAFAVAAQPTGFGRRSASLLVCREVARPYKELPRADVHWCV